MAQVNIERRFAHRTYGEIGSVNLVADVAEIKIDGKPIPAESTEYLLHFALQSLQDAYAGAKNEDEAKAAWQKKLDALMAGTIGVRGGGEGVSEETRVARSVVRQMVKAKFGAKSPEWAAFTGLSDADQNAKLDEWYTANAEKLAPAVAEELKRREAARKAKNKLTDAVVFEL